MWKNNNNKNKDEENTFCKEEKQCKLLGEKGCDCKSDNECKFKVSL